MSRERDEEIYSEDEVLDSWGESDTILLEQTVILDVPTVVCKYRLKEKSNSVYCSRLDQWVSGRLCVQCEDRELEFLKPELVALVG